MRLMSSGRVGISFPKGKCIVFCVCADGKPAHVGDFSLWNLHLASKLFDFFRIFAHRFNTDVVCDGLLWLLPFHYSAPMTCSPFSLPVLNIQYSIGPGIFSVFQPNRPL